MSNNKKPNQAQACAFMEMNMKNWIVITVFRHLVIGEEKNLIFIEMHSPSVGKSIEMTIFLA